MGCDEIRVGMGTKQVVLLADDGLERGEPVWRADSASFAVFDRYRNDLELFPDVRPALEALSQRFTLIAVTNGNANLDTIGIGGKAMYEENKWHFLVLPLSVVGSMIAAKWFYRGEPAG